MTADERLEALLNHAGQTISDLPRVNGIGMPYGVDRYEPLLKAASDFIQFNAPAGFEVFNVIQYALHLADVIDRLEQALENVCGERDYLRHAVRVDGCWTCTNSDSGMECHRPEGCVLNDKGRCVGYEYAGVPEDWRPEK